VCACIYRAECSYVYDYLRLYCVTYQKMNGDCTRRSSFLHLTNTINGLGLHIGVVFSTTDCTSKSTQKGRSLEATTSCQGY
jgi:hypothetical protein